MVVVFLLLSPLSNKLVMVLQQLHKEVGELKQQEIIGELTETKFRAAFPTGLTVGAGTRFLRLTTAKAVDDFLPSGTTARALNAGTLTNPGSNYQNVLAGQVVALFLA
jgi:hypothetical protein